MYLHLEQLCLGIWLHTHTITTTDVFPDLGELAEKLSDACVVTVGVSMQAMISTYGTVR